MTLTTLQKLAQIERRKTIYAILFRNAGVGIQFYEQGNCTFRIDVHSECPDAATSHSWRSHLVVKRYHRTFVQAVAAEYERLKKS